MIQSRRLLFFLAARTHTVAPAQLSVSGNNEGWLRNGRLEFEPSAWGFTGGPLQPVSVPHYKRGVSGAGLDMVPSLKHSLVVARQVHGDKAGPR